MDEFIRRNLQLWGHCPHNLGIKTIEAQVAIKLATVGVADPEVRQAFCKFSEKAIPIGGTIGPAQFVFGNIGSDQPVAQRQADVPRG
jgi:hypothetical protein